jgi:surface protein G
MKKKSSLTLDNEFILYCELNNITDVEKLAKETFNRGFSFLKYPETPLNGYKEKVVEKEVIKEIIKEVPVEKIVEVIKEVPVEKIITKEIIKEVPVEKIVEVIKEVPIEIKGDTKVVTKEIIKEVPIEKIVEVIKEIPVDRIVRDDDEIELLKIENQELKSQLDKINDSLNKLNKAKYMKNSDLGSLYSE